MRTWLAIAALIMATTAASQTPGSRSTPAKTAAAAAPGPGSLRTDGLNFGDDLMRVYVGDFAQVGFARDSTEFTLLLSSYMNTFSRQCAADLPPNKVEIMTQECARESWTVNGYGVEQPGSRHCVSYRTVGTGRYADPEVYNLQQRLDAATARAMVGGVLGGMKPGGDPVSGMRRMTDVAVYARNDMPTLLQANGCSSAGVKRLQANLLRFGQGQEAIVMPGAAAALADKGAATEGPRREQNHQRLLDDLISEQSQAWMMNRYQAGSVRPLSVARDSQGRAREVVAGYSYLSMGKMAAGKVRLVFVDGAPQCLYFADLPESCRAPSPRIVSAYRKNQYATEAGTELASRPAPVAPAPAPAPTPAAAQPQAAQADVEPPEPVRPAARADPVESSPAPAQAAASGPAAPPEGASAAPTRQAMPQDRAAALQERQAAIRERQCTALRTSIDRMRESLANGAPQRAQRAEAQVARLEQMHAQQCGR